MKILVRCYDEIIYQWRTAKYDEKGFRLVDDGCYIPEYNIVSIMNDNRKDYIKCSSCGAIISKRGDKFAEHKRDSASIKPCLGCSCLHVSEKSVCSDKFVKNANGTYTRIKKSITNPLCTSHWRNPAIDSEVAIAHCPKRQCADAYGMEIVDIFTTYPGVFDDIITIDKILDNGYERIEWDNEYVLNSELEIRAVVNELGIVDKFSCTAHPFNNWLYYSKKYDELFTTCNKKYELLDTSANSELGEKVKEYIANLYR